MTSYSVREAARVLGVSVTLVYGLCSSKRLRHERHGLRRGIIRIPADALEAYRQTVTIAAAGKETSVPPPPKVKLRHIKL